MFDSGERPFRFSRGSGKTLAERQKDQLDSFPIRITPGDSRYRSGQTQFEGPTTSAIRPEIERNLYSLRLRHEVSRLELEVPKKAKRLALVRIVKGDEDSCRSDNLAETAYNISDMVNVWQL